MRFMEMIAPNKVRNGVVLLCQNAVQLSLSSFLGISLLPFQDILFGKKWVLETVFNFPFYAKDVLNSGTDIDKKMSNSILLCFYLFDLLKR